MKVLFTFYVPSGGMETINRQRSIALKKVGIEADFLYYENKRNLINDHKSTVYITKDFNEIKKIINDGNYDAIIVTSDFSLLPFIRSIGYSGKIIVEIQGYGSIDNTKKTFTNFEQVVNQHADAFLDPKTPHIMQLLDEIFPAIQKFHFNNCIDSDTFHYKPSDAIPSEPIIGWVGRIEDNKNWGEFLLIASYLNRRLKRKLSIYMFEDPTLSTPQERAKFQRLIKQQHLEENLTLHSNVPNDEMADYYSLIGDSGGFLCSTSKVEGAPQTALEAMSCRCPILASDSGGIQSAVIHNQTGKFYKLGSPMNGFKEGLELMTNIELRNRIINQALNHVRTNFNHELYGHHFKTMLLELGID